LKIALIGADGQLGTDLYRYFSGKGENITGLTLADIEICNKKVCSNVLFDLKPELVINTAAYNLVDDAESEVSTAFDVNAAGVNNVSGACLAMDCALMHFSTDFVFGGYEKNSPYNEDDCPSPISIYGISKLAGEHIIRYMLQRYYIIRTCGLYGHAGSLGKGYNFVELMIKMAKEGKPVNVVNDQVLTPSSTKDLTEKLYELVKTGKYGTYHMTNTGSCSWYEFACEIFKIAGLNPEIKPISTDSFGAKARRPAYSVLDNRNLRNAGIKDLRDWKDALADYISERK